MYVGMYVCMRESHRVSFQFLVYTSIDEQTCPPYMGINDLADAELC